MALSRGLLALIVASFAFGSSAILIRFATEASAVALTFFRLTIAAAAMILLAITTRKLKRPSSRDVLILGASGVLLSLHFLTFIFAVKETTVSNATFLVNTGPVMLAVLSPLVLKEKTTAREVVSVVLGTIGVLLIALSGGGFQTVNVGDLSALLAAFFVALYSLAGRNLRTAGMSTAAYTSYVYSVAALVSVVFIWTSGTSVTEPYDLQNIAAILALGLVPTGIGHSLYNLALGSVKTVTASLFPLSEPIIATILAIMLFGETPTIIQVAGYSLIALAVIVVVTAFKEASFVPLE